MDDNTNMSERLGVNKEEFAVKGSQFTALYLERQLVGVVTQQNLVDFIEKEYSHNELVFMTLAFLTERSEEIKNNIGNLDGLIGSLKEKLESIRNGAKKNSN